MATLSKNSGHQDLLPSPSPSTAVGIWPPPPAPTGPAGTRTIVVEDRLRAGLQGHPRPPSAPPGLRRWARRAFLSPRAALRYLHRHDRRRKVGPRRHPVPDLVIVVLQIRLEVLDRLTIHPGGTLVRLDSPYASHTSCFGIETACPPDPTCPLVSSQNSRLLAQTTDEPAPSLHPHYQGFTTTTGRSAGARRDGTQRLTVSAARRAPSRHPPPCQRRAAVSAPPSHVPCRSRRPDSRRLHAGHHLANRRAPARLIPGLLDAPVSMPFPTSRHVISGSLTLVFPVPT